MSKGSHLHASLRNAHSNYIINVRPVVFCFLFSSLEETKNVTNAEANDLVCLCCRGHWIAMNWTIVEQRTAVWDIDIGGINATHQLITDYITTSNCSVEFGVRV